MMRAHLLVFTILLFNQSAIAQVTGKWISIDDSSGQPRSVVEVVERNGKLFGKVVKIYSKPNEDPDPVCDQCEDDDPRFKKKVIGMEILQALKKNGEAYTGGHILDPENGKVYRCKIWLEDKALKVRGYWGPFFRTQTWQREAARP